MVWLALPSCCFLAHVRLPSSTAAAAVHSSAFPRTAADCSVNPTPPCSSRALSSASFLLWASYMGRGHGNVCGHMAWHGIWRASLRPGCSMALHDPMRHLCPRQPTIFHVRSPLASVASVHSSTAHSAGPATALRPSISSSWVVQT